MSLAKHRLNHMDSLHFLEEMNFENCDGKLLLSVTYETIVSCFLNGLVTKFAASL
jgi:hypothetical protein